ncbi:MAG: VCBS repeat-containing protein [Bacteroidales bacterium]
MTKTDPRTKNKRHIVRTLVLVLFLLILFLGVPFLVLRYHATQNGLTTREVVQRKLLRGQGERTHDPGEGEATEGERVDFLAPRAIGFGFEENPMISHLVPEDLDDDGLLDVIVCDALDNFISWIRQEPDGSFREIILAEELIAPAHAQVYDFDQDGDKDILVAVLGLLYPSNDKIGSVVVLENQGDFTFTKRVVADHIARVSDVRAGDLDGDGDNDLAVAQFGYDDGETRWIENRGDWQFESHMLQNLSGPINIEIVDIDGDGDQDMLSIVSQEWEEFYFYINDGAGHFQMKLLWGSDNEDFGSSGFTLYDVNQDGLLDILYANRDAFDYIPPQGKPWHGLQWFENKGNLEFAYHRLCDFVGAYSLRPADVDRDGDLDLFAVSAFNLWEDPAAQSFIWLENTGQETYIRRDITNDPTHLIIMDTGDFNNDGLPDFVTGGMYPYPPFDRMSRVVLWINDGSLVQTPDQE